jgi:CMP-N-acetylneuraminic acid synthetase/mannose-6-phosphate isomerase-like protein (cupin superfamily)
MKNVAVIPIALGSKRIPDKNLVLVDGFPMVYYVVKACKESGIFDEIYINSEHEIFKAIAAELGVKFYTREGSNGGSKCTMTNSSKTCLEERCTIHDHFLMDFISNVECDYLVQVHTTSPLLTGETIKSFVETLHQMDSLVTTEKTYSESFVKGMPVNFNKNKKQETQSLDPVESISWALAGWKKDTFLTEYSTGPTFCGNSGFFAIDKIEAIDVDTYEDLYIAEACLNHRKRKESVGKFYYQNNITSIESDLVDLIALDGSPIPQDKVQGHNETLMDLVKIENLLGTDKDWCYPVVFTDNDQIAFIRQSKGKGCRKHYHPTKDEWWVIFRGEFEYSLWHPGSDTNKAPDKIITAGPGQLVFLPKGTTHIIRCVSEEPGIRLACGSREMAHVYVK